MPDESDRTVYLDCNATTPVEPAVQDLVVHYLCEEFGNAGSRTHEFGLRAKRAADQSREQVAEGCGARADEVVFTSGATEANNMAILGLAAHGLATKRHHVVTTAIEHKAVLEPVDQLRSHGFEVSIVEPTAGGWIEPDSIIAQLRPETVLVSVMHANNETGVLQPIPEITDKLGSHDCFLHVDAAQSFGKEPDTLRNERIDMISLSGHKLYAPKGIGALIARRRGRERLPLTPIMVGGGQERGLRPGTLPVHLVVGLGLAVELALNNATPRRKRCLELRERLFETLKGLDVQINGDQNRSQPHVVNLGIGGIDSEAVMLTLKGCVAISNGSACTSRTYEPSHVLSAMGMTEEALHAATRWSWSHLTPEPDWELLRQRLESLR